MIFEEKLYRVKDNYNKQSKIKDISVELGNNLISGLY